MKKKPKKVTPPKPKPKPIKKPPVKKASLAAQLAPPPQDLSNLGRQPIEFYVERYGNNFRVIDNMGFVFANGRWVSVDVDGFPYMKREICPGDPLFLAV